jgi:hypothetical protein
MWNGKELIIEEKKKSSFFNQLDPLVVSAKLFRKKVLVLTQKTSESIFF